VVEPRPDHGLEVAAPRAPIAETIPSLDDEAAPTPVEQAAVALSARLQAIAPAPPEAPGPLEGGEPAPFPTHAEAPPNRPMRPESVPFKVEPAPEPPPVDGAEILRRRIFGHPEPHPKLDLGGLWPLILLGAGGLVVFGGAVFAAFQAKPADGTLSPLGLGLMVVGLIGVMSVASAVYFLLEKLGGRED
jgi:hypothetical protein